MTTAREVSLAYSRLGIAMQSPEFAEAISRSASQVVELMGRIDRPTTLAAGHIPSEPDATYAPVVIDLTAVTSGSKLFTDDLRSLVGGEQVQWLIAVYVFVLGRREF